MRASVPEGYNTLITRPLQQDNRLVKDVDALRLALWQVPSKVHRIPLIAPIEKWQLIGVLLSASLNRLSSSGCRICCLLGLPALSGVLKPILIPEAAVLGKLTVYRPVNQSAHVVHILATPLYLHIGPVEQ